MDVLGLDDKSSRKVGTHISVHTVVPCVVGAGVSNFWCSLCGCHEFNGGFAFLSMWLLIFVIFMKLK